MPNVFIGHQGYPRVNVGYLLTQKYNHHDDPMFFARNNFSIPDVVLKRRQLLSSKITAKVFNPNASFLESAQLVAKSANEVEAEIQMSGLKGTVSYDDVAMPHGPTGNLEKVDVTEHVKIPKIIQKFTDDTDVLATTALCEMNKKKIDEYKLTKLLSLGTLGIRRRLVPTKWSITAVDNNVGKSIRSDILVGDESVEKIYMGGYLGNYYVICVLPGPFAFEFVEIIYPNTRHNPSLEFNVIRDSEQVTGRRGYAQNTAGGYYAARLPIMKLFNDMGIQGSVIVYRCITSDYYTPLGVWVVREGIKKALENPVEIVDGKNVFNQSADLLAKFGVVDAEKIVRESELYKERQQSLKKWFGK